MKSKVHVRRDDNVVVIAGEDRGKRGTVLSVDHEKGRAIVEGVNRHTRAVRRGPQNPRGGLEERECPIHVSNLMHAEKYDARYGTGTGAGEAQNEEKQNDVEENEGS